MQLITTRNKEISFAELKKAISSGNGLELIRPGDKFAIELKNGEHVNAVCGGYVNEKRARFVLEDCLAEKWRMNDTPTNKGGYLKSEGRRHVLEDKDGRAETVVAALDRLERLYGAAFYRIFKTITVDNGSEFADADGIERSARRKDAKRTTVYYCHAYSSCERGTNENINRMIRRQFPKGTDFDKVTAAEVKRVETWLNNYPREILGFMSSAQAFELAFDRAA